MERGESSEEVFSYGIPKHDIILEQMSLVMPTQTESILQHGLHDVGGTRARSHETALHGGRKFERGRNCESASTDLDPLPTSPHLFPAFLSSFVHSFFRFPFRDPRSLFDAAVKVKGERREARRGRILLQRVGGPPEGGREGEGRFLGRG